MDLSYPVFRLSTEKPNSIEGVSYYLYETEENQYDYKIIDDLTIPGDNLAKRRLKLKMRGVPLYKITKAIFFIGDFIKINRPDMWFIDSKGKIFDYHKETIAKLKFLKIERLLRIPSGGVIIEVEGIPNRFKALFPPNKENDKFAGILFINKVPVFYGFYDKPYKESWRKV